ncbi:hypothetical protein GGX14DRAFT_405082 [Mycena pura]|uniref:Uncharacterized protein n=1 Tax=Mycena pura TaxID=153505 RepID=A0AAD6Y4M0_9AGAR|nr:hypothetical protein GGX14DRAFT_405082 [Mycena pura]
MCATGTDVDRVLQRPGSKLKLIIIVIPQTWGAIGACAPGHQSDELDQVLDGVPHGAYYTQVTLKLAVATRKGYTCCNSNYLSESSNGPPFDSESGDDMNPMVQGAQLPQVRCLEMLAGVRLHLMVQGAHLLQFMSHPPRSQEVPVRSGDDPAQPHTYLHLNVRAPWPSWLRRTTVTESVVIVRSRVRNSLEQLFFKKETKSTPSGVLLTGSPISAKPSFSKFSRKRARKDNHENGASSPGPPIGRSSPFPFT